MMKKLLLSLILSIALSTASFHAQAQGYFNRAEEGQIKFGVRGGVNYFNLGSLTFDNGEDYEEFSFLNDIAFRTKSKVGFQIGAYADIWISPDFSFIPEINVTRKGAKLNDSTTFENDLIGDVTIYGNLASELYYVEAPLLLSYKPTSVFTFFAGPQVSYLIFQKLTSLKEDGSVDDEIFGTEGLQKLVIGGVAGAQVNLTPNINLNIRYVTDLQSAFKKDLNLPKMRNSGFSLSIGYSF